MAKKERAKKLSWTDYLLVIASVVLGGKALERIFFERRTHSCPICAYPIEEGTTRCPRCSNQIHWVRA